jgi:hypothetical protein
MGGLHVTVCALNAKVDIPTKFLPYLDEADEIRAEWGPVDTDYHNKLEKYEKTGKLIKITGTDCGCRALDLIVSNYPNPTDGTEFYKMEKNKIDEFLRNLPSTGEVVMVTGKVILPRLEKELDDKKIDYDVNAEFNYNLPILKTLQDGVLTI